jgi:hypothetical protein
MKTNELTGAALDWAVAKCEGYTDLHRIAGRMAHEPQLGMYPPRRAYGVMDLFELGFSTDWSLAGPIIEREGIAIDCLRCGGKIDGWIASLPMFDEAKYQESSPTPLIAAMRCYVASKLGAEVETPKELII